MNPALAYECCDRYGSDLVINCVDLDLLPSLARAFGVAYSGEWMAEGTQSPQTPYVVDYVRLIGEGRIDKAVQLYWRFQSAYKVLSDLQIPLLNKGGHPWQHIKYYQWLTGGNGGLISIDGQTPEQTGGRLNAATREQLRKALQDVGIVTVDRADDEFIPGVANFNKGVGPDAYKKRPAYE